MELKECDYKILEVLLQNCRIPFNQISKRTGINPMTVINRIRRMERERVIKRYAVKINHQKLGFNIVAHVLVRSDYVQARKDKSTQESIAKDLMKYPFVSCISTISGESDIILRIRARDVKELNKFVAKISHLEGVVKTVTLMVLHDIARTAENHRNLMRFMYDKKYQKEMIGDEKFDTLLEEEPRALASEM